MSRNNAHPGTDPGKHWRQETLLLHQDAHLATDTSVVAPIHYSATFRADTPEEFAEMANTPRHPGFYSRYGNPVHKRVEAVIAALEGTETALLTASGMGAISTTVLGLVKQGDHVIAQRRHYMSTSKLFEEVLPRFGVASTIVDQTDLDELAAAIRPETRLIMVETPVNPTLTLTDLAAVATLARARGILTIADNTFASPLNQKPHDLGIDIVVHSATKYFGGHHDITAGAVCCSEELAEKIWSMHVTLGSVLSPMDAWLLLRGLRTLSLRMERINANALALAQWLETHPAVERVYYPGLASHPQHELARRQMSGYGAVIAFSLKGGFQAGTRFVSALRLATHAVSLGGVETLAVHTAAMWAGTMTEEQMISAGIEPNFIRMSVGVEHIDDLKADLAQALEPDPAGI
ncbi:trans-sulfuration enzyme family protein [Parapusillimonas granuli]|uniref:Aminotransferase class I/II-fold pyridoxal phosphate-dependent enzyme n=1 Tax=Parapusillimonas granuli TaxID=380911 RepID=A0A853G277_9BURK|nr:aminotransferase class I/II-fold pyridoxal phosphate-dependent enzyme [Parapusillimonas granuli]MBB5213752.1 cystathionine beta-lyase/methionine-gamma-lyase [Parapusillimonas granuli]MEB2398828.1 aminotransferase class I/II-fold pyridoxal phosphate-dependent enzyme [Alcaligenaceae bacterium]NYT48586.1 aminotransferase class I/II-fold pyridoxal phosphate-dependent enzyme [Parapusillimonas granuli]